MGKSTRDWYGVVKIALTPASVNATTGAEQTFTVNGLRTTDVVLSVSKPTVQAGLAVAGWRVSAADTIALNFTNCTAASIVPTAGETYTITVLQPEDITTRTRLTSP